MYIGDLDDEKMLQMAIKGYVAGVGDEYTEYYTPEEMSQEYDSAMGNFVWNRNIYDSKIMKKVQLQ